ncbi:hypothetical protein GCM10022198_16500 [Klugiella xanthotipulae]|uniref:Lipoprotein n=1 Tax=Klugiella xanthotipulae TaxID=244735 RepID=A0A543HH75_9MICO|nr:hypothetical protein [Klugiella xanthotipulae]TQM57686.1 hypothetical protein FB466_2682 [Klugiella xanthotipulae]
MHFLRRSRWFRGATVGAVLAIPLVASGCTPATAEDRAANVVTEFFDLLASGNAEGVRPLLADDAEITADTSDFLDNSFYADVVARPTQATVGNTYEFEPGLWYVNVDYVIGTADTKRSITVSVSEETEGKPLISGWLHSRLSIFPSEAPGFLTINGSLQTTDFAKEQTVTALPGIYSFEYVDPDGFGTLDADGGKGSPFEVEFPVNSDQLTQSAPPSAGTHTTALSPQPVLREGVADEFDTALTKVINSCSATGFTGATCPEEITSQVNGDQGSISAGTATWTERPVSERITPADQWRFDAPYRVSFTRNGTTETVEVDLQGILLPDARGHVTLEWDNGSDS